MFWASLVLDLRPGSKSLVDMQLHLAEKNVFHTCSIKETPNYVCTTIVLQWVGVFLSLGRFGIKYRNNEADNLYHYVFFVQE